MGSGFYARSGGLGSGRGSPRLLPSPRRPLPKRGCGTARRWYTAGHSTLRLFFFSTRAWFCLPPGNWGNDLGVPAFAIKPFFFDVGKAGGAVLGVDVVPCWPTGSGITEESGSGDRNGSWSVNLVQRRARRRALRWTLHTVYGRRDHRRGPKAPDVVPGGPTRSIPALDHHCPNSFLVLLVWVRLSRFWFQAGSGGLGAGWGSALFFGGALFLCSSLSPGCLYLFRDLARERTARKRNKAEITAR